MNHTFGSYTAKRLFRTFCALLAAVMLLSSVASCDTPSKKEVTPADAAFPFEDPSMEESLDRFINTFARYYTVNHGAEWKYDCNSAADGSGNILACIVTPASCVDWRLFSEIPEEDRFIEKTNDPKGWAAESNAYYVFEAEIAEMIARELFYVSDTDIDRLIRQGEEDRCFYQYGDRFYTVYEGGTDAEVKISHRTVRPDGEKYKVSFDTAIISQSYEDGLCYSLYSCTAEMAYKSVAGRYYWSLYRFDSVIK